MSQPIPMTNMRPVGNQIPTMRSGPSIPPQMVGGAPAASTVRAPSPVSSTTTSSGESFLDKLMNLSTTTKIIIGLSIIALGIAGYLAYKRYVYMTMQEHMNGLMHCMEMGPTPEMLAQMGYAAAAMHQNHPAMIPEMNCEGDKCVPRPVEPQLAQQPPTNNEQQETVSPSSEQQ